MGLPSFALAVAPCWSETLPSFSVWASSARSLSSCGCAQPSGAAKTNATRDTAAIVVRFIAFPPWFRPVLRLRLQHRVGQRGEEVSPLIKINVTLDTLPVNELHSAPDHLSEVAMDTET